MIPFHDFSQGWTLSIFSSLICVTGCLIVFLDDVYKLLLPQRVTSKYPFNLKENYGFMNGSLAFSAGCLLFTGLYRLLPEAKLDFEKTQENPNVLLLVSFVGGTVFCAIFNRCLHMLTTESVVHCSHDHVDSHSHSHSGGHDLEVQIGHHGQDCGHVSGQKGKDDVGGFDGYGHEIDHHSDEHSHSHANFHGHSRTYSHGPNHSHSHSHSGSHSHSHSHSQNCHNENETLTSWNEADNDQLNYTQEPGNDGTDNASETSPLIIRRKSLIHFFGRISSEEELLGECKGFSSAELCEYQQSGKLHFCELPKFSDHQHDQHGLHSIKSQDTLNAHFNHKLSEHHHHHVNSPTSRLMMIGIQTVLAITLHKLPEGFVTYVTSETDPQLGFSIFLSLLIHNLMEGFLMCLPLYYAFGGSKFSKLKAVSISSLLGGLSQPLGAFLGFLFISYYGRDDIDVEKLNQIFGISLAVTSGLLTVIALSMYGSAVSFSGQTNFISFWCLVGMCTIGLLSIFTNLQ